jgi:hypothetical protein
LILSHTLNLILFFINSFTHSGTGSLILNKLFSS